MAQYRHGAAQSQHRLRVRRAHWPRQSNAPRKHPGHRLNLGRCARHGDVLQASVAAARSINQAFTEPVVTAAPGGAGGGGAILTVFGAEVLERYRRILDGAVSTAADDLTALARRARPEAGQKV